jgi:hypothetical protein
MSFVDRDLKPITLDRWRHLRVMDHYKWVRRYNNNKVLCTAVWLGYKDGPFEVYFNPNLEVAGRITVQSCQTMQEAINLYEHFLAEHTDSEFVPSWDGNMMLLEVGNILTNKPTQVDLSGIEQFTGIEMHEEYGSW